MTAPFRSTAPPVLRISLPRRLARFLIAAGARDGRPPETFEITFALSGRDIETVTVQAPSKEAAVEQARRYLFANIYPRTVNGETQSPSWWPALEGER